MGNDNTADKQVKNRGHENIKPYQWKEGQSGNPAGSSLVMLVISF